MIELTSIDDIKKLIANNSIVLLYFFSMDCSVCTSLLPKIEKILSNHKKIKSAKINISRLTQVAGEFSILTLPALTLYIDGIEYIREARFISTNSLDKKINRLYNLKFN